MSLKDIHAVEADQSIALWQGIRNVLWNVLRVGRMNRSRRAVVLLDKARGKISIRRKPDKQCASLHARCNLERIFRTTHTE